MSSHSARQEISFMEHIGSLLCSQEPATGTCPDPDASSPQLLTHFPKFHYNIIFHLCMGLLSGLFPLGFPTKKFYVFLISTVHITCPVHHILLDLVKCTCFEAPHYAVCSNLLPLPPTYAQIFSLAPCFLNIFSL
jgi:hypothetical protein